MRWLGRLLIAAVVWAAVLMIGYALGIHPTIAEVAVVALASVLSNGVMEGSK